ncbi:COMM domain-containing protein 3 isoform X2 [Eucyclogobius newberryi]|uniref:COMM domain-containing protein 3 isoform X2 n=1 Tax=Eucyclogobius newberryi TaxID=166745 RepID=UPI003B5A3DDB
MELSESVQKGLKLLADPSVFDPRGFSVLLDVSFLSLLSAHGDAAVLDHPELKNHDSVLLKQSHAAVVTFILECVKLNTDKSTLSIGRRRPEINDVSWRLQYQIKSGQVDKVDEPFYLITLNTENEARTCEDVNFTCTVEQLQDLVGKLKDAAKSMERASQM